ncbi:MAG TPA: 30S ribosomal protein S6 [Oligoflexia bacterium]|nr:30S ribosomal protein S6 [Oligoflexia bacterium]
MKKSTNLTIGYETTYISKPDSGDDALRSFLEKLKGIIKAHGGEVVAVEDWGRRRLAYPIQKETRGVYTHVVYSGNNSLVAELERNLRINEQVIRFLTVKIADEIDTATFKRKPTANIAATAVPLPAAAVSAAAPITE